MFEQKRSVYLCIVAVGDNSTRLWSDDGDGQTLSPSSLAAQ